MFEYRKSERKKSPTPSQPVANSNSSTTSAMRAAKSQARGLAHIRALKLKLQRSAQLSSGFQAETSTSATDSDERRTDPISETEAEVRADEKDRIAVADELQRYLDEGLIGDEELSDLSLTRYWQVRTLQLSEYGHDGLRLTLRFYISLINTNFHRCIM